MKKIYLLLLAVICSFVSVQTVSAQAASWIGNSYFVINGTWYNGSGTANTALPNSLGDVKFLKLAGQIQSYGDNDGANNPATLCYKIDNGTEKQVTLAWFKYANNNNYFGYTSGEVAFIEDFAALANGEHTLTMYFKKASTHSNANNGYLYDSNNSQNFKVKFNKVAHSLTVTSALWASLYLDYPAEVPTGCKAYYAKSVSESTVTLSSIDAGSVIPANTGVVVKANAATDYSFEYSSSTAATVSGNLFEGTTTAKSYSYVENGSNNVYTLAGVNNGTPEFKLYTGTTLGANKSYLPASSIEGAPSRISFIIDETTAVENVEAEEVVKYMENGQLFIKKNGVVYNAMGQIVK